MDTLLLAVLMAAPALWFLLLCLPSAAANRHPRRLGAAGEWGALLALPGAVAAALAVCVGGPVRLAVAGFTALYLDSLSVVMALLIAFIGWVIFRYSREYLGGDPRQGIFLQWLGATLGSVWLLVLAGNLVLLLGAWISMSLCLHRLLVFYADRPAALLSARKKFIFSRMADICLALSAFLLYQHFNTLEIPAVLSEARRAAAGAAGGGLQAAALFLALGAILKSAQFPFHTWLPDTMEAPTPVSALMHAGIISAGGFLMIRMSPVVILAPWVLHLLAGMGAVTAIFGSLVMLTQTSIKKSLAFSTVAQMGYMMLQCGLGAFALATLHLVAHSLYKAHAFLSCGTTVRQTPPPALSGGALEGSRPAAGLGFLFALLAGGGIVLAVGSVFGIPLGEEPGLIVLGAVLSMALATLLWRARPASRLLFLQGLGLAAAICLGDFTLHHGFARLLAGAVPERLPALDGPGAAVMGAIILAFFAVFLLQGQLASWQDAVWCRRLYVLFLNRFYVNALVNRFLLKIWPVDKA